NEARSKRHRCRQEMLLHQAFQTRRAEVWWGAIPTRVARRCCGGNSEALTNDRARPQKRMEVPSGEYAKDVFLNVVQLALRSFNLADFFFEFVKQRCFFQPVPDRQFEIVVVPRFLNVLI